MLIFGVLFMRRAVPFIGGYGLALAAIWVPNAKLANRRGAPFTLYAAFYICPKNSVTLAQKKKAHRGALGASVGLFCTC